jgi:hypothetical protein
VRATSGAFKVGHYFCKLIVFFLLFLPLLRSKTKI